MLSLDNNNSVIYKKNENFNTTKIPDQQHEMCQDSIFFNRNLQFLSDVIIIKTKALLPQAQVTSADFWLSSLGPLFLLLPLTFISFGLHMF